MKRYLILSVIFLFCSSSLLAQQNINTDKKKWGSIGLSVGQPIMLGKWFNDDNNHYMARPAYPMLHLNANVRIYKQFGAHLSFGVGRNKRSDIPSDYNNIPSINMNDYYQENIFNSRGDRSVEDLDVALYYKFFHHNWAFVPYIGFKMMSLENSTLRYSLKAKGASDKYLVDYYWARDNINSSNTKNYYFLSVKFKTERKVSKSVNLELGVELNLMVANNAKYKEMVSDAYSQKVLYEKSKKSKSPANMAFSLGFNFR